MKIKLLKPYYPKKIGNKIDKLLKSGQITEGFYTNLFESKLVKFLNNPNCVVVNSGTSGLTLIYHMLNLKADEEVITTPFTCMATNEPLFNAKIKFKFCDVEPETGNASINSILKLITKKTRAIVVVHWGGQPFNIPLLRSKIRKDIKIVEDAAHALGAEINGKKIGNHGDFICFSFQAVKHIHTGDGGLVVCKNKNYANKARQLRWFGLSRNYNGNKWLQDIKYSGFKFHLNNIGGLIGCEQMKYLDKILSIHMRNGRYYDNNIINKKIKLVKRYKNLKSSYWIYSIFVDDKKKFKKFMSNYFIECDEISFRNDKYSVFKKIKIQETRGLKYIDRHLINIPVGPWLTLKKIKYITKIINQY